MAVTKLMNARQLSPRAERAHAMKNCLGAITMITDLLAKDVSGLDRDRLDRLKRAASRLGELLDADVAEETGKAKHLIDRTPCSVATIVHSVMDQVADRAENVKVDVIAHCEGGHIEGNEAALGECLLNLMVNAVDASPPGGAVLLRTRATDDGDQVWTVQDTGRGMPADQLAELGIPFSSRTRGGWGLGLALVQNTIVSHGGLLHVQSREGAGTTFSIWLPGKG